MIQAGNTNKERGPVRPPAGDLIRPQQQLPPQPQLLQQVFSQQQLLPQP